MMVVTLARTGHEAQLHMDLTPCPCGEHSFDRTSVVITLPDGDLGRRYAGTCPSCGAGREFTYRLPAVPLESPRFAYGGAEPSRLLDAAQWLWVSDWYLRSVPPGAEDLPPDQRRIARARLMAAIAAIDEVVKFIPANGDTVPEWAVWTPLGRTVREADGQRLSAGTLAAARSAYVQALEKLGHETPTRDGAAN
jgi:hypothetical protein